MIRLLLNNIEAILIITSNANKYRPIIQTFKNNAPKLTVKRKVEAVAIQYYNIPRISVTAAISGIAITNFNSSVFL